MKNYKIISLIILLYSCHQKNDSLTTNDKQPPNPLAISINNKANILLFKYGTNKDSLLKASRLMDTALKIDSAAIFVFNKIVVLRKLKKNCEILLLCNFLIKKDKNNFYPYLIKANIYTIQKETNLADFNYAEASRLLKSKSPMNCENCFFLLIISLIKNDAKGISSYSAEYKTLNCRNFGDAEDIGKHFNRDDYLDNN